MHETVIAELCAGESQLEATIMKAFTEQVGL